MADQRINIQYTKPAIVRWISNAHARAIYAAIQSLTPGAHFIVTPEMFPPPEAKRYEARIIEGQGEQVAMACACRELNKRLRRWRVGAKAWLTRDDPPDIAVMLFDKKPHLDARACDVSIGP